MIASNDKVSIVVPIFNVETQLRRCIASILVQGYRNMEIILVDDGSTDSSGKICDEYSDDERFIVIHQRNGGLSDARNAGIDAAKGSWLFFLDSDDYISPYCIETLVAVAIESGADIVECRFERIGDHELVRWNKPKAQIETITGEEAIARFLDYDGTWIMAWNKLYRRELFESIRFPVGRLNEDEFTTPYLVEQCSCYAMTSDVLYAYVQREGSIMHSAFEQRRFDAIEAHRRRLNAFSLKYHGRYDGIIAFHYLSACIKLLDAYADEMDAEQREFLKHERDRCLDTLESSKVPLKRKLQITMFSMVPHLAAKLSGRKGLPNA